MAWIEWAAIAGSVLILMIAIAGTRELAKRDATQEEDDE